MNQRQQFLNYVKHGGAPICSPQIGAGAGFDTKLAGKKRVSETTLEDTLAAVERFDIVPLLNIGVCDFACLNPVLSWKEVSRATDDLGRITYQHALDTPQGVLTRTFIDEAMGGVQTKYPVQEPEDLNALEYYIDAAIDGDFAPVTECVKAAVDVVEGKEALDVQWAVQPYELLCFPNTVDTVMLANDCPERFRSLMDKIVILDEKLMNAVVEGGADFIFLGGPGSEMISPRYYEEFIIPYSKLVTDIAHSKGLLVYSHICSPIEPFLTMGFYNKMGIDLFETLSPPPVGNVTSLSDAMTKIDPDICTRGNLGLDILLNVTPETVEEKTFEIIEATRGRKHIVAASDYLFYDVPEENVAAMARAVRRAKA